MPFILLALFILALVFGPSLWVKRVLSKHSEHRSDLPGTGGELARHLMKQHQLNEVALETTDRGDHYDPESRAIRLSPNVMNGKSLTAVATAAHEFGHALQHATSYRALTTRSVLVKNAMLIQKVAGAAIFLVPILAVIPGMAVVSRLLFIFIIGAMFLSALVHFVTLPVEFDASFGRALPILKKGQYVSDRDMTIIRKILLACALTYVSQALMSVLNLGRWIRLLRR